jgi:hypothetical protein
MMYTVRDRLCRGPAVRGNSVGVHGWLYCMWEIGVRISGYRLTRGCFRCSSRNVTSVVFVLLTLHLLTQIWHRDVEATFNSS